MTRWLKGRRQPLGGGLFLTLFAVFIIQITARFGFQQATALDR
jgi:hypothetical protein